MDINKKEINVIFSKFLDCISRMYDVGIQEASLEDSTESLDKAQDAFSLSYAELIASIQDITGLIYNSSEEKFMSVESTPHGYREKDESS